MSIVFVGTDFHDSSFPALERLERVAPRIREHLRSQRELVEGSLVVATCNRFEVYLDTAHQREALADVVAAIAVALDESVHTTSKMFRVLQDGGAVNHLFQVACGLESMVVGEGEIMAQLRDSLAWAQDLGTLSTPLLRATERAFRVSKKLTTSHGLAQTGRSVIDTALDIAHATHPTTARTTVLVIGTGAYARVVIAALQRRGVTAITVFSRSGRAPDFATSHGVGHVGEADLVSEFYASDLVVSASGAPGYVISADMIAARPAPVSPVLCIDVALSKDLDPKLERLGHATLITLESIRQEVPREHTDTIIAAERIVNDEALAFVAEDLSRDVDPVVASLRAYVSGLIAEEVRMTQHRLGEDVSLEIQRSLHRVTNHLLHTPSVRARALAKDGLAEDYRRAVDILFGSEVTEGV